MGHQITPREFEELDAFIVVRHPPGESAAADKAWSALALMGTGVPVYTHSTNATSAVVIRVYKSMRQADYPAHEGEHWLQSFLQDISSEPPSDAVGYVSLATISTILKDVSMPGDRPMRPAATKQAQRNHLLHSERLCRLPCCKAFFEDVVPTDGRQAILL